MHKLTDQEEEILEFLWIEIVEKKNKPNISILKDGEIITQLKEKNLLNSSQESLLTEEGLTQAKACVRRHRLAERLVCDILNAKDPILHEASCKFEHGLHHGLEDNICTLLGHPKRCPHGKPIPEGECCKKFEKITQQLIMPLKDLRPSEEGKISYINTADDQVLKKLVSMGIFPGNYIKLLHRFPSFVFEMNKATFAIDQELAGNIFVLVLRK